MKANGEYVSDKTVLRVVEGLEKLKSFKTSDLQATFYRLGFGRNKKHAASNLIRRMKHHGLIIYDRRKREWICN